MDKPTAPGLKWRPRKSGEVIPYWCASAAAILAGYPVKAVRLSRDAGDAALVTRCARLQSEMLMWLERSETSPLFDGTWRALLDFYERDPESTYARLKPSSRHPYSIYLGKLRAHIGALRISECDGRDLRRWFAVWRGEKNRLAAARMALCVLKAAVSWGIQCRLPDCAEFRAILSEVEFEAPKPRTAAPTATDIEAARKAAHAVDRPRRALAYALQYDTVLRQWDVIGEWVDLADPRPTAVLGYGRKWIGLSWSHIGADQVLRYTPGKTDATTEARIVVDLRECPMVLEELSRIPHEARVGPVVLDERTALPYAYEVYRRAWRKDAGAAGIPRTVWNRDLRAGAVTEARAAGAATDDLAKVAGHTDRRTTAEVYDRATLEAHRRVAVARRAHRDRLNGPGT